MWGAIIAAITLVDLLEAQFFPKSLLVDRVEVALFLVTLMVVAADLVLNRRQWYRCVDTLFNWTRDGKSRKALLLREGGMASVFCSGQFWALLCAFSH